MEEDDDSDEDGQQSQQQLMYQTYRIRLFAANLPVTGLFRGKACDCFAVVTSTESTERVQRKASAAQEEEQLYSRNSSSVIQPIHARNSSITSVGSASSHTASAIWGQTEVVCQSRNPQWTTTIPMKYQTGSDTFFYVHIFQHAPDQKEHMQSFGTALFHVTDLLSTKKCTRVKRLRTGGCVFCRLEAVRDHSNVHRTVCLKLQATNLVLPGGNNKWLRRSAPDTVLEIAKREASSGLWLVVCRSAPVQESFDPIYDRVQIDLESLCGGNLDCHLRLQVMLVQQSRGRSNHGVRGSTGDSSKHKLIGMTETTLRHMLQTSANGMASASTGVMLEQQNGKHVDDDDDDDGFSDDDLEHDINNNNPAKVSFQLQRNATKFKVVGRLAVLQASVRSDENDEQGLALDDWNGDDKEAEAVVEIVDLSVLSTIMPPPTPVMATLTRTFTSYIQDDGCQIDFCVAIDFTSSNGDPRQKDSYHYRSDNTLNDYEETISSIGQALQTYSQSQEYSVYGFGAKFEVGGPVRHIFQCGPAPTVHGVDGILQAYKSIFKSDLIMSGPTVFHQVLQAAAVRAKRHHEIMRQTPCYAVLLVITDGTIAPSDFEATRQRLDAYSTMPLSIVFVGVGRSDFRSMYQLCQSRLGVRCNTTFVEFRRHQYNPAALGEAALRNVPTQLCEYMSLQGL